MLWVQTSGGASYRAAPGADLYASHQSYDHERYIDSMLSVFLLLLMGCLWGLQFAALKLAVGGGYSDIDVLMIALLLIAIIYAAVLYLQGAWFRLNFRLIVFLLVTAVLGYVLPLAAALTVAGEIDAGLIALIACMTPVFTVALSLILRSERVSTRRLMAVALGLASVMLVLVPQLHLPGRGTFVWLSLAMTVPVCAAIENIYVARRWPGDYSPTQLVAGETVMAAILVAPFSLVLGQPIALPLDFGSAEAGIFLFVAAGAVESFIYFYLIRTRGSVLVSFGYFIALFAGIGWGKLIFDESHSVLVWASVALLVSALALISGRSALPNR